MKGRSYRFSSTDPHEDWVDGSWTVDCVCGVNFDDGEEMVNCDDCGVWVHTRCSRYVKGEELFTCDKCKSKNNVNDSEETEVAQLLVELPTKTLGMENSCTRNVPLKRPFRLWTEIPTEEKVHVQGIPGGDPALFEGLSSVFSRELWKCTGYVPKKFNFKYREFPCWDEEEKKDEIENGYQEENGAGVLFSMSKENVIAAPASALVAMRSLDVKGNSDLKLGCSKEANLWDSGGAEMKHSQSALKKDKRLLRPLITNKRRKELFGGSKERTKKKVEVVEDGKKGFVGKTVRHKGYSKPSLSRKDTEPEGLASDVGITKIEKSKKAAFEESNEGGVALKKGSDESGITEIGAECSREQNLSDVHGNGIGKQEEKAGHHFRIVLKSSATNDPSVLGGKDVPLNEANKEEERQGTIADAPENNAIDSPERLRKPSLGFTVEKNCDDVSGKISSRKNKLQNEMADTGAAGAVGQQTLDPIDSKVSGTSTSQISEASEFSKVTPSSSLPDDHKRQPVDMVSEGINSGNRDTSIELKRELVVSGAEKDILETKPGSGLSQETSKPCRPVPHTVSVYSRPKMVLCIGKSSSSSATEKSSRCEDNPKPSTSRNSNPGSKQQPSDGDANAIDEDCVSSDVIRERDRDHEPSEKPLKEHPKFSVNSTKSMQQNRTLLSSVSKTRESSTSLKASSGAQLNGGSSEAPSKHSHAGTFQKNEKSGQSIFQSSTKNPVQSIISLTPNLSDEELALRLHHQLNSSPRVPRVPRMRQPGSLPLSPTATSFKRTSSSSSKDHATFSRRKNKDASKEGCRKSRDDDRCSTRSTKTRRSPDSRTQQDSGSRGGSLSTKGEENETRKTSSYSSRKVILPPNSTTSTSSGPCSSNELNEHNKPSPHSSPRNNSTPVHRTLPGLINEIMSKGKRMTYEELCNAVLPHWPHLRKHNGERYAYSSHSQAVLDCLRNRHEWARLVDRGPKTNSGKKKRKLDVAEESDENESSQGGRKRLRRHSQVEEFPKGKRKARKRRRLSLQGKGIKVLRKKRNEEEEVSEEDEEGAFSDTSDESDFCEEDEEEEGDGRATTAGAREVSASSSEEAEATP
ncbi:PHD finger protein [Cardamine amara subsp. amara]|uniref:PHD finger protein n=1 Tax=Cardamine amara subsp. amara TaxID=228776 RepID=A0ABD1BHQ1_CARAN